jgi:hypothetical protein
MQTFLDDVAKIITASQDELDRVKIIVPSIRSITFLKEALKKKITVPKLAPEIISIEGFIKELSGLERISKLDLLYVFFDVYLNNTPKKMQDKMDQFFNWAPSIIQEFNDLDSQLTDPNALFDFMGAINEIDKWDPEASERLTNRHLDFQKEIPKLYELLYKHLLNQQQGYAGMQLREAVRNLAFYTEQQLPFHYFVGFNALTKAEETIFQELLATGKAEVLWDIDQQFFNDPFQGAGHFIRQYYSKWNALKAKPKDAFPELFAAEKQIEIISVGKNTTQAKLAVQLASSLFEKNANESTVIALGDESLLHPTLSALPPKELPWNITMGYPLKRSTYAEFFHTLFNLLEYDEDSGYPLLLVKELMHIVYIDSILDQKGSKIKAILKDFEQSNRLFIASKTLTQGGETQKIIFSPFKNISIFLERMVQLTNAIQEYYLVKDDDPLQLHYSACFRDLWEQIVKLHETRPFMSTLNDVKMVFDLLLEKETLDFSGDALSKLQIMGLLETRLLDFDNVIITHVNEGIIPFGKTPASLIPFDVKKKFEMNTFIEQDHLYAYHFFRLLQRSKKVYLLYNSTPEGLFSGEKSRFLIQLEYFQSLNHKLTFKQVELSVEKEPISIQQAYKTNAVLEQLDSIAEEGFSPSSLTQYIRNPYQFYEERMLKIKPLKTIEANLSAMDKGTIMHQVLEVLYLPFLNVSLVEDDFNQMLEQLPIVLKQNFDSLYKNDDLRTGKNFIIYNVIEKILKSFLIQERLLVSQGNTLIIKALEHEFSTPVWIENIQKRIVFKGTVDRIDTLNGVLRIVDYKTGNVTGTDLAFSDWNEIISDSKKSALFQVLLYHYILKAEFPDQDGVAGVIPLKNFENTFLVASKKISYNTKEPLLMNTEAYDAFEHELFKLISQIYDPSLPFIFK